MKGKWSPGKITALVIGGIAAGMLLLTAFYVSVAQLLTGMRLLKMAENRASERRSRQEQYDDREPSAEQIPYVNGEADSLEENEEESPESSDYYEFHNAIRKDLSYQVEFEDYADMFGRDNVLLSMNYPVVSGKAPENLTGINNAIQREMEEVREYVSSVAEEIDRDSSFFFEGESYVTYMDEEILSIAFVEYGYLDDDFYESYVVSVNIDMESGMALTNSQLLDIDDSFSIEFRNRSERQNGEISYLYSFTDQEITELLSDDDSLIIFYTPLGMEVGFNYYYGQGWVTVTYKDYQKYRRHF